MMYFSFAKTSLLKLFAVRFRGLLWSLLLLEMLAVSLASKSAWAALQPPELTGPVWDQANRLTRQERVRLAEKLRQVHELGGPQIQVAILMSLEGEPIESLSIRLVDYWKLGDRDLDNGVLVLMAISERKMRIEVGQGLEGDLTDLESSRIIREVMAPLMKQNLPALALDAGVDAILAQMQPGAAPIPKAKSIRKPLLDFLIILILAFGALMSNFLFPFGRRGLRRGVYGWGSGSGGFGSSGGFGGSGGSSGGWGGGGGGFSGGGASGDW